MTSLLPNITESTRIIVNKVKRCVVGRLSSIICFTVPISSHHIPEAEPGADGAYNFVDNIHAVGIVAGILAAFF